MLAKMIAWAPTRDEAIDRLNRGLEDADVRGIVTNIPFLSALVTHPGRARQRDRYRFHRTRTEEPDAARSARRTISNLARRVAAILGEEGNAARTDAHSPWLTSGWMPVGRRQRLFTFRDGQGASTRSACNTATVRRRCRSANAKSPSSPHPMPTGGFDLTLHGIKSHIVAVIEGHELYLRTRNGRFDLHWVDPFGGDDEEQVGEDKIVAPLPGTVVALLAEVGATLEKGAPILTLEVMKMEQTLRAPFAGVLKAIKCKVGDIVQEGVELAEIEPAAA